MFKSKEEIDDLRNTLRSYMHLANEDQQLLFKRMYSPNNLEWDIDTVIDNVKTDKLAWAINQCENTFNK